MSLLKPATAGSPIASELREEISLLDIEDLETRLATSRNKIPLYREAIRKASAILDTRYRENLNITDIVRGRAWVIDQILSLAWLQQQWPDAKDISLVAVGGYGRGELLPHSDIDILILTRRNRNTKYRNCISTFTTLLWDIGLEIGQSVRSIKQCRQEAIGDILSLIHI